MNRLLLLLMSLQLSLGVASPRAAHAASRDVKAVITTSLYGVAAGTVLGLISYPISKKVRTVGIGASVGLYLGIIVGIYFIEHRDDPGNPLRRGSAPSREGAGASEHFLVNLPERSVDQFERLAAPPAVEMSWELARF